MILVGKGAQISGPENLPCSHITSHLGDKEWNNKVTDLCLQQIHWSRFPFIDHEFLPRPLIGQISYTHSEDHWFLGLQRTHAQRGSVDHKSRFLQRPRDFAAAAHWQDKPHAQQREQHRNCDWSTFHYEGESASFRDDGDRFRVRESSEGAEAATPSQARTATKRVPLESREKDDSSGTSSSTLPARKHNFFGLSILR